MLHFFRFLFSKAFVINLLIALALIAGGLYGTLRFLDQFTLHGKTLEVPDLVGQNFIGIDSLLTSDGFSVQVNDSIFVNGKPFGEILEQNPEARTTVKQGRKIYVSITASEPPKITVPQLVDMSLRQATSLMETYGLEIGELIYKPDLCKNCILEMQYKGKEIEAETRINRGSVIDLVIGQGLSNELTAVPYITSLSAQEASDVLKAKSLNIGSLNFDETVKDKQDSLKAVVYKQYPIYTDEPTVPMGSPIDLFLTLDTNRIQHSVNPTDSIE